MARVTRVVDRALHFESAGYVLECFGGRVRLPRFLAPLDLIVKHQDTGAEGFVFSLNLSNPWVGELIYQEAIYREERLV